MISKGQIKCVKEEKFAHYRIGYVESQKVFKAIGADNDSGSTKFFILTISEDGKILNRENGSLNDYPRFIGQGKRILDWSRKEKRDILYLSDTLQELK